MQALADAVEFRPAPPGGLCVVLVKRRPDTVS